MNGGAGVFGNGAKIIGDTSSGNSSTTPIDDGNTFTGTAELNSSPDLLVTVATDQNGTLYIDFSVDGTNFDSTLTYAYDTSRINVPHVLVKGSRYVRIRFENDSGSNQTYFRLATYYGAFNKLTSSINSTLAETFDAIAVRPTDYRSEVAMGKRQGRAEVNKFGYNLDVDNGTEEIIASFGGAFDPTTDIIQDAQSFTIAYNNATDGEGQTGATSLLVTYIDANYLTQDAIHTLGATGSDETSFTGLGINRAVVLSSGTAATNNNDIDFTATTDGTTQAKIPAGNSVTQQLLFHTQINHTALLEWLYINIVKISSGNVPVVTIKGYSWSRVTSTVYEIFRETLDTEVENTLQVSPPLPFVLGGREVIYFTADTSINNTSVSGRFSGIEERVS